MMTMPISYNLITVMGPTASGKTAFAAQLAHRINGEVISADSRQVYRKMNIGTGKDYSDYIVNGSQVPFHLIDIADPGYKYSVFEYQRDFTRVYQDITARGKLPVLCGGSGMYIDAVTRRYRLEEVPRNDALRNKLSMKSLEELTDILSELKVLHNISDTDTLEHALKAIEIAVYYRDNKGIKQVMPDFNTLFIGIRYDRETERTRITDRLEKRLNQGMIEEVKELINSGIPPDTLTYYGLEYRFITLFLKGMLDYKVMVAQLNTAIHQFAKRQRTWFRKMERQGCKIHWLDGDMTDDQKIVTVLQIMKQ